MSPAVRLGALPMTRAERQKRWLWNKRKQCDCGKTISGRGKTGRCRSCARQTGTATARCSLCTEVIPQETPRFWVIRVAHGGRNDRKSNRKLISTVCEPCWQARSSGRST